VPIVEVGFAGLPGIANAADALVFVGPGITVEIGFDPTTFATLAGIPIPAPVPGAVPAPTIPQVVLALIDTGAQQSMIDEALAIQLALPLVNRQPYAGVGGPGTANVYLAHITIPLLGTTQYGAFMGAQLQAGGQSHLALIGRTLLRGTLLVYDGEKGSVRIAR
jgi:hypothetical protein